MRSIDDHLRHAWFEDGMRDPEEAAEGWLAQALRSPHAPELLLPLVREHASHQFRSFQRATYEQPPREDDGKSSYGPRSGGQASLTRAQRWLSEVVWIPGTGLKPWRDVTVADLKTRREHFELTLSGVRQSIRFIEGLEKALEAHQAETVGELPESALPVLSYHASSSPATASPSSVSKRSHGPVSPRQQNRNGPREKRQQ
jgi:hypothetical protein